MSYDEVSKDARDLIKRYICMLVLTLGYCKTCTSTWFGWEHLDPLQFDMARIIGVYVYLRIIDYMSCFLCLGAIHI